MKKLNSLATLTQDTYSYISTNWTMLLKTYLYAVLLYFGAGMGLGVLIMLVAFASQGLGLELNLLTGSLLGLLSTGLLVFFFALGGRVLLLELTAIRQPITGIRQTFKAISYKDGLSIYWLLILMILAVYSGILLLIVPGLIVATWLAFTIFIWKPGMSVPEIMVKSREYVRGYFWPVLGRVFLAGIMYTAIWYLSMEAYTQLAAINDLLGVIGYIAYMLIFAITTMSMYRYSYELYLNLVKIKGQLKPTLSSGRSLRYKLLAYGPISLLLIGVIIAVATNPLENLQKASELTLEEMQIEEVQP